MVGKNHSIQAFKKTSNRVLIIIKLVEYLIKNVKIHRLPLEFPTFYV